MAITRATNLAAVGSGLGANPAQPIDVGPGIQMDGSSTGIITATTFSGTATNAGTAVNIGVGATGYSLVLSGDLTAANITVGGTLTYDDVTNIDSIGIITARSGVSIADSIFHTGDTNTAIRFPAADTFTVETAGSERLRVDSSGRSLLNTNSARTNYFNSTSYGPLLNLEGTGNSNRVLSFIHNDNSGAPLLVLGATGGSSAGSNTLIGSSGKFGFLSFQGADGSELVEGAKITGEVDGTPAANDMPGRLVFSTTADGATSPTERLRITSRGGFHFSNGFMNETVKINTTARTGTQAVNLDDGMVHYFSTNSSGTWKPNFTMSAGDDINATIAIGDVFSPTMIVAKGATTHFANAIQVDGSDVTPEFSGGAPTDGGGSGTFDVYNYTIIKTGDDTFKAFAAVSTYE